MQWYRHQQLRQRLAPLAHGARQQLTEHPRVRGVVLVLELADELVRRRFET
jgi:hypothetical protein